MLFFLFKSFMLFCFSPYYISLISYSFFNNFHVLYNSLWFITPNYWIIPIMEPHPSISLCLTQVRIEKKMWRVEEYKELITFSKYLAMTENELHWTKRRKLWNLLCFHRKNFIINKEAIQCTQESQTNMP